MHVPVPLRGAASLPFRAFGIRPSRMNPNLCTICELMFSKVMRARKIAIDATILFADMRGYTSLSQNFAADEMTALLDDFYDECGAAIWEYDGLLNKMMGDAVMAVFNFPIKQGDHAGQAVKAARDIQQRWAARRTALAETFGPAAATIEVGIGIDCGKVSFGEFGRSRQDLTAIGTVVNTASRVQGVAKGNEILVTQAVQERVADLKDSQAQDYELKGFEAPVTLYQA